MKFKQLSSPFVQHHFCMDHSTFVSLRGDPIKLIVKHTFIGVKYSAGYDCLALRREKSEPVIGCDTWSLNSCISRAQDHSETPATPSTCASVNGGDELCWDDGSGCWASCSVSSPRGSEEDNCVFNPEVSLQDSQGVLDDDDKTRTTIML